MRKIQPEIGESLAIFQNTNTIVFVTLFLYSLTCCIKDVIKGKIFWRLNEKVTAHEAATA